MACLHVFSFVTCTVYIADDMVRVMCNPYYFLSVGRITWNPDDLDKRCWGLFNLRQIEQKGHILISVYVVW